MPSTQIALIRGINVGRAKRVAMADLRTLGEGLRFGDVRTLLNSGNVVFTTSGPPDKNAALLENAMTKRLGVSARVIVLTATELDEAVKRNPLLRIARDPSRLHVAVLREPSDRRNLAPLARKDWAPEVLAVGKRVAYLWCPDGMAESPLAEAVGRALADAVTIRNWATITKLHALVASRR